MTEKTGSPKSISSIMMMHTPSNAGYAISELEKLFFDSGMVLSGGDSSKIHFSYKTLTTGRPETLPAGFANYINVDFASCQKADLLRIEEYVRSNGIQLAIIFDLQPVHPIVDALRRGGVQTIVGYYGCQISSLMPPWKLWIKRQMFRLARHKMDGLIFESHAMADLAILGRGVPSERVDIVPLGVDTDEYQPHQSKLTHELFSFPEGRKVVVYAGHMEARKGVATLVQAAIQLLVNKKRTDVCFALFGNRPGESAVYQEMYSGKGVDGLIRFGGYRPDLNEVFPGCYCGVIPSTGWDSFTRSSLEMAACGLPVIVSDTGGLPETIEHERTGIVYRAGDVEELAGSIELLLDNPQLAARYAAAGRDRCVKSYSKEVQKRDFLSAVRKRISY
jgi:glycosyltransferase involved in cell wall biosynthesis